MAREGHAEILSLLLVEGDTDVEFWKRIKECSIGQCRTKIRKLKGLYNINRKVLDRIVQHSNQNSEELVRVYCCLDRESREGRVPGFDIKRIRKYVKDERIQNVLSVDLIWATQQVESWFFYDIEGIYDFLRVPRAQRNVRAYRPPEKFVYKDLQRLFEKYGKTYNKGNRASNFINTLNIEKIVGACGELRDGISLIEAQADDLTNHILRRRSRSE